MRLVDKITELMLIVYFALLLPSPDYEQHYTSQTDKLLLTFLTNEFRLNLS